MSRLENRSRPGSGLSSAVALVLQGGTVVALVLTAAGLGWLAIEGQPVQGEHLAVPLHQLAELGVLFTAEGLVNAGLLVLVSVPVVCVAIAAVWYIRRRYWPYAAVTLIALGVLAAAVALLP